MSHLHFSNSNSRTLNDSNFQNQNTVQNTYGYQFKGHILIRFKIKGLTKNILQYDNAYPLYTTPSCGRGTWCM